MPIMLHLQNPNNNKNNYTNQITIVIIVMQTQREIQL